MSAVLSIRADYVLTETYISIATKLKLSHALLFLFLVEIYACKWPQTHGVMYLQSCGVVRGDI